MTRLLLLALLGTCSSAHAVVIRDDVDDATYRIEASAFPALADMPGEGHGVLIAPQWIVTAAHTVTWQSEVKQVTLAGSPREVERVVLHPGYSKPPQQLTDRAMATWDWTLFVARISSTDDIALVKLAQPVTDVVPATLHGGDDVFGQTVRIIGKGATGTGTKGFGLDSPHCTELRHAYNTVTSAHDRWFCYVFDAPPEGLPLEGASGSGDSGGPVLVQVGGEWRLAGLTAWTAAQGSDRTRFGRYGQISCNVRLSHYKAWIESVIPVQP